MKFGHLEGDEGGRDYITPKGRQGLYLVYKQYIHCQLGDYILPTTLYKNLKNHLVCCFPVQIGGHHSAILP